MNPNLLATLMKSARPYINEMELAALLKGTDASRHGKVKRMIAQGQLLHFRRGLYGLTSKVGHAILPHPFELAQQIYGPSYISFESALSYHNLIPEAVYTITSATSKRAREFQNSLGVFSYQHLPADNLYVGVERIQEASFQFFLATPWKAICDYVYGYKKNWKDFSPLEKSLRIDTDTLPILTEDEAFSLTEYYHRERMTRFLKGILKSQS